MMLCWEQILGVCVARASVTAIRGLPRVEGPSDFGFNSQRTTGFGFEAGHRTLRWPWSSGPSLGKMACFQRSASLAL